MGTIDVMRKAMEAMENLLANGQDFTATRDAGRESITALRAELERLEAVEPACNPHPKAPHGFNRNASHSAGRSVCDCESWDPYEEGYQAGLLAGLAHDTAPTAPSIPAMDRVEPAAWAISYDGETPSSLWDAGDGALLDLEVKRQGGTTRKVALYAAAPSIPVLTVAELKDRAPPTLYSADECGAFSSGARWAYALAAERAGVQIKEEK